jgi:hypothetical protein
MCTGHLLGTLPCFPYRDQEKSVQKPQESGNKLGLLSTVIIALMVAIVVFGTRKNFCDGLGVCVSEQQITHAMAVSFILLAIICIFAILWRRRITHHD